MLDNFYTTGSAISNDCLHTYCREEGLDYRYTISGGNGECRRASRHRSFFEGFARKRKRRSEACPGGCARQPL